MAFFFPVLRNEFGVLYMLSKLSAELYPEPMNNFKFKSLKFWFLIGRINYDFL